MSRRFVSLLIAIIMVCAISPTAFAMDEPLTTNDEKHIEFSGISQLTLGETMQCVMIGPDGNTEEIGIEKVANSTRAAGETWRVWYQGINSKSEFYMTVSNNKVTTVYDYSITITGGTYEEASLTKTSTYGKLTFKAVSLGGIISGTCWLKGAVTGEDDQIEVTWQM